MPGIQHLGKMDWVKYEPVPIHAAITATRMHSCCAIFHLVITFVTRMRLLEVKGFSILAWAALLPLAWSFQYSVIDRFAAPISLCLQPLYLEAGQAIQTDEESLKKSLTYSILSARVIEDQGSHLSAGVNRCSSNYVCWVYSLLWSLSKQGPFYRFIDRPLAYRNAKVCGEIS